MQPASTTSPEGGDLAALDRAVAALEAQRSVLGDEVVEMALAPLRERRAALLASQLGEQRRLVTVLFADLVDFTVLSRSLDAEDTRAIVGACFARWNAAVQAQGGVVEKFIGDAVMAVFGLRRSFEDDAERAVRAALDMTTATEQLSVDIQRRYGVDVHMRVGIDTGEVVVSTLGERPGQDFVAVGPTVNRASRLQSAAPVDRVLVSTETYRQIRSAFNVEPRTGLSLKGIDTPVDAYLVVSERPRGFRMDRVGAVEGIEAPTIGRASELTFLQERFLDVEHEAGYRVVTVIGEAGVGKSRLLRDFDLWLAERPERAWWFRGRASPAGQNRPAGLLRDLIATRMEIQDSDPPDVIEGKLREGFTRAFSATDAVRAAHLVGVWLGFQLGDQPSGVPTDPLSLHNQATTLLAQYFGRLSESHPVLLLLEDLHWTDNATLRWLDAAATTLAESPVLVVATTRPTFFEDHPAWGDGLPHHGRLTLDSLTRAESRRLVTALLHRLDALPAKLVDLVIDAAEGNPFYVEELVSWLIDSGVIVPGHPRWSVVSELVGSLVVPPSLKGVLQARLDALTSEERAVLQRASVVGRVFWDESVAHLDPDRPATTETGENAAFDRLRERDILFERELSTFETAREFLFKHALLRDVAYDSVLRARRQAYHRRAAQWLAEISARTGRVDEYAAIVAEHYDRGGDPSAPDWYMRAGRRAARVFALDDATGLLDRAEELAPASRPDLLFDIVTVREDVFERLGDRARQDADLDRMSQLVATLNDPSRSVTTLLARSRRAFEASEYPDAVDLATQAGDEARRAGLAERVAEAYLWAGKALTWDERDDEARARLDTALQLSRQEGRRALAAETLRYLAMLASNRGAYGESLELGKAARAEFAADGDLEAESMALAQLGVTYYGLGRVREAREAFEQALPVFQTSGHLYRQAVCVGNLASIGLLDGDVSASERWSRDAIEMSTQLEDHEASATHWTVLGNVLSWTNQWPEAEDAFRTAEGIARQIGATSIALDTSVWHDVAALDYEKDDSSVIERARAAVAEAQDASVPPQVLGRAQLVLGYALVRSEKPDEALPVITEARDELAQTEVPASVLECDACVVAALLRAGRGYQARDAAVHVAQRLDRETVAVMLRPARVLSTLWEALSHADSHLDAAARIRELARDFVDRRLSGCDDEATRERFLSVPSVAHLVSLLDEETSDSP